MENKLKEIFDFLSANREYNHSFQERFYKSVLIPYDTSKDKVISLLYHIANTQSQPRINKLANFYKGIISENNCFDSFANFISKINPDRPQVCFENLFNGMQRQDGWGEKTAALFTKSIFHLHNGNYSASLKIWTDVPNTISEVDGFYLPVDVVIRSIFNKLNNTKNVTFDNINKTLKSKYTRQQIEVWDDLWFWGFITQNSSGDQRVFKWNENKYWALKESDKNPKMIFEIKNKAELFLKIITNDN